MKKCIELFGLGVLMLIAANILRGNAAGLEYIIFYSGMSVVIVAEGYFLYKAFQYIGSVYKRLIKESK